MSHIWLVQVLVLLCVAGPAAGYQLEGSVTVNLHRAERTESPWQGDSFGRSRTTTADSESLTVTFRFTPSPGVGPDTQSAHLAYDRKVTEAIEEVDLTCGQMGAEDVGTKSTTTTTSFRGALVPAEFDTVGRGSLAFEPLEHPRLGEEQSFRAVLHLGMARTNAGKGKVRVTSEEDLACFDNEGELEFFDPVQELESVPGTLGFNAGSFEHPAVFRITDGAPQPLTGTYGYRAGEKPAYSLADGADYWDTVEVTFDLRVVELPGPVISLSDDHPYRATVVEIDGSRSTGEFQGSEWSWTVDPETCVFPGTRRYEPARDERPELKGVMNFTSEDFTGDFAWFDMAARAYRNGWGSDNRDQIRLSTPILCPVTITLALTEGPVRVETSRHVAVRPRPWRSDFGYTWIPRDAIHTLHTPSLSGPPGTLSWDGEGLYETNRLCLVEGVLFDRRTCGTPVPGRYPDGSLEPSTPLSSRALYREIEVAMVSTGDEPGFNENPPEVSDLIEIVEGKGPFSRLYYLKENPVALWQRIVLAKAEPGVRVSEACRRDLTEARRSRLDAKLTSARSRGVNFNDGATATEPMPLFDPATTLEATIGITADSIRHKVLEILGYFDRAASISPDLGRLPSWLDYPNCR